MAIQARDNSKKLPSRFGAACHVLALVRVLVTLR